MKKFFIKTLGCKTNQIESAQMAEILTCNGYEETQNIQEANFYILNTCSVTHIADSKNLSFIRRVKRENSNIKTVVTGCMAQLEKENLLENDLIDFVIGNYEKNDILTIIENNEKCCVSDIFLHDLFRYEKIHNPQRTRASVKIQDGCNNRCSYCTIPFARGKNRSNPIKNVIEQINLYSDEGFKEIVLTGIHIGQWGNDFQPYQTLQNLLEEIEKTNITRYRLGSLNPLELSNEFIDFLANSKKFCPHFHLSLQSVCNKTLKAMNRRYSEEQIKHLVDYINKKFDNAFIGCDIIVGFAGETKKDFDITYKNLSELNLSRIHVFPYSRRKGTIADCMSEHVGEEEKKRRSNLIQEVSQLKLKNFFMKNLNTEQEVIIEKKRDKKTNLLKGVTKNYINILIDEKDSYKDTMQRVIITESLIEQEKMIGKIVRLS